MTGADRFKTLKGCMKIIAQLLLSFAVYINLQAQKIALPAIVKFKLGDDMAWSDPAFNDAGWEDRSLGRGFSATGIKENVYAWYRIKVFIPSSIKKAAEKKGVIKISLGRIDDADQSFFNGKLAGQTGGMPPHYETKYNVDRYYFVPVAEVKWDHENLIAVRLFSPDYGGVGMYQGDYYISPVQFYDSVAVEQQVHTTPEYAFSTTLRFTNHGSGRFDGKVLYTIADARNSTLYSETLPVKLPAQTGSWYAALFTTYKPEGPGVYKLSYQVTDDSSAAVLQKQWLYLPDTNVQISYGTEPVPVVENKIKDFFTSTRLQDVQMNGYLGNRMIKNLQERLLKVDEEGITGGYWQRPGTHPWIGEHIGKYLEAACNTWKYTHDTALKKQMDRVMYKLVNAQLEDGYLGTYIPANYWTSWDVWSHKYNLYGLLAYYKTTGYAPALEACKRMGDLLCRTFGYQPGQRDIILAGEHMGMAATSILDPMVELYRYTGDKKYLAFCYYILDAWEQPNGPKIISAILKTGKVTDAGNGKAYEMISNFVGIVSLCRLTGDEKLLKTITTAWNDIVKNRLYITGTCSAHEYFKPEGILPAGEEDQMGEGCVTTTWIQLNQQLLSITGEMKYAEEIERSVYNHLLAAENPQTGCVSYYTPLQGKKPYSCEITCCTSSVPRGIALVPYFGLGKINSNPALLLYEPATYKEELITTNGQVVQLSLEVKSDFPAKEGAGIIVKPSAAASFALVLRVPAWCRSFVAKVGNEEYHPAKDKTQCMVQRRWEPGDKIMVSFEMPVQLLNGGKSYPGRMAFQRGPQVLALDESLSRNEALPAESTSKIKWDVQQIITSGITGYLPATWIGKQAFTVLVSSAKLKTKKQLILVPYADASQAGGKINVWLPVQKSKTALW